MCVCVRVWDPSQAEAAACAERDVAVQRATAAESASAAMGERLAALSGSLEVVNVAAAALEADAKAARKDAVAAEAEAAAAVERGERQADERVASAAQAAAHQAAKHNKVCVRCLAHLRPAWTPTQQTRHCLCGRHRTAFVSAGRTTN